MKTKKMFIEITSLDEVDDIKIYDVIKKNFPNSFIKIHFVKKVTRSDIE